MAAPFMPSYKRVGLEYHAMTTGTAYRLNFLYMQSKEALYGSNCCRIVDSEFLVQKR